MRIEKIFTCNLLKDDHENDFLIAQEAVNLMLF